MTSAGFCASPLWACSMMRRRRGRSSSCSTISSGRTSRPCNFCDCWSRATSAHAFWLWAPVEGLSRPARIPSWARSLRCDVSLACGSRTRWPRRSRGGCLHGGGRGSCAPAIGLGFAQAIWRETDGNPFFVGEVPRHLTEIGSILSRQSGRWRTSEEIERVALPDSVREVIGARVARLGDAGGDVLSLAAVIEREFELDVLSGASRTTRTIFWGSSMPPRPRLLCLKFRNTPCGSASCMHSYGTRFDQDLEPPAGRAHRRIAEAMEAMTGAETRPPARSPATRSPARRVIGSGVFPTPSGRSGRTHGLCPLRMPPTGSKAHVNRPIRNRNLPGTCLLHSVWPKRPPCRVSRNEQGRLPDPPGTSPEEERIQRLRSGPPSCSQANPNSTWLETSLVPSCSKRPSQTSRRPAASGLS